MIFTNSDKLKRLFSVIGLVIAIIIVGIFLWLFFKREAVNDDVVDDNNNVSQRKNDADFSNEPFEVRQSNQEAVDYSVSLKQLAFSIAERFGTYSSQSNFKGLNDLKIISTDRMIETLNKIIISANNNPQIYSSLTTRALSSKLIEYNKDSGRATVEVNTLRTEYGQEENKYYQTIVLGFVFNDNKWKLDGANWQ